MLKKLQPLLHTQLVRLSRIWLLLRKGPNLPASWLPRRKKTISTLAEKLSSAEEKGKKYDGLYESEKTAQEQIHALERTIKELEKDHATEKRELQSEAEQKLSAAQKDAALETLNAVAAKEREMNGQLLQLERENAKLQAKIELLEARLQQQP